MSANETNCVLVLLCSSQILSDTRHYERVQQNRATMNRPGDISVMRYCLASPIGANVGMGGCRRAEACVNGVMGTG